MDSSHMPMSNNIEDRRQDTNGPAPYTIDEMLAAMDRYDQLRVSESKGAKSRLAKDAGVKDIK